MLVDKLSSMFNINEQPKQHNDINEPSNQFLRKKTEISNSVNANLESLFKLK